MGSATPLKIGLVVFVVLVVNGLLIIPYYSDILSGRVKPIAVDYVADHANDLPSLPVLFELEKRSKGRWRHQLKGKRRDPRDRSAVQQLLRSKKTRQFFVNESWFDYYNAYNMSAYDTAFMRELSVAISGDAENNPVYVDAYRAVVCLIPKNGIEMLKMVALRMLYFALHNLDDANWWRVGAGGHIHANKDIRQRRLSVSNYDEDKLREIYNNKQTKFTVFIRDPLHRALSGFLHFKWWFHTKFDFDTFDGLSSHLVRQMERNADINQHVRPQHLFCDLDHTIQRYRVFSFENRTHRKLFLDEIDGDLWSHIGVNGWHPQLHEALNEKYKQKQDDFVEYGKNISQQSLMDFSSPVQHSTGASQKLLQYYTVQNLGIFLDIYRRDYRLFNLTLPIFICDIIQSASSNDSEHDVSALQSMIQTKFDAYQYDTIKHCL